MTIAKGASPTWEIEEKSRDVHVLRVNELGVPLLYLADLHWDNAKTNLRLLERHLKQAQAAGAPVHIFGDFFCAMQGKWDKRADQNALRPEHRGNNYFDLLVDTAVEWFMPYAKSLALITIGNHEGSCSQRNQTNLTERFVTLMRAKGSPVRMGAFAGFVNNRVDVRKSKTHSFVTCYHHGYGGGGEVTRGMIDNSRTRGQWDADIFISGHVHWRNADNNRRIELDAHNSKIVEKEQWFLRAGTYKEEHLGGKGYHIEKGRGARPRGGWWIDLSSDRIQEGGVDSTRLLYTPRPTDG
jgi:hypothetical protein